MFNQNFVKLKFIFLTLGICKLRLTKISRLIFLTRVFIDYFKSDKFIDDLSETPSSNLEAYEHSILRNSNVFSSVPTVLDKTTCWLLSH